MAKAISSSSWISTRLVGAVLVAGVVLSATLGWIDYGRRKALLQAELTRRITAAAHAAQAAIQITLTANRHAPTATILSVLEQDPIVGGVRLHTGAHLVDPEDPVDDPNLREILLPAGVTVAPLPIPLDAPARLRLPFVVGTEVYELDVLVDGPAARARLGERLMEAQALNWLLLAAVTLVGLLIVRRIVGEPVRALVDAAQHQDAAELRRLAGRPGEFGQLADCLARLLQDTAATGADVADQRRALDDQWLRLPIAMLRADSDGHVTQANTAAADLLGLPAETVGGRDLPALVAEADRPAVVEILRRLREGANTQRLEVRLRSDNQALRDVLLQAAAIHDAQGRLRAVHLALADVAVCRQAQREARQAAATLTAVLDRVSDGVLLTAEHGRVIACNEPMAAILQRPAEQVVGMVAANPELWRRVAPAAGTGLAEQLATLPEQIPDPTAAAGGLRVATSRGVFRVRREPVLDDMAGGAGDECAWLARDVTAVEQHDQDVARQDQRMRVLRQFSAAAAGAASLDALLERSVALLQRLFEVEAVGVIVGDPAAAPVKQLIYRGNVPHLLEPNRHLVVSLQEHLLPEVLRGADCLHWSELPRTGTWTGAALDAGLTALAATPLPGPAGGLGLLWLGQRAGRPIDRHHLAILQTLAPLLAARVEIVQLLQRHGSLAVPADRLRVGPASTRRVAG